MADFAICQNLPDFVLATGTHLCSLFDIILFADDTTLLYSHPDPDIEWKIPIVNTELSEVNNWFKANKLSVNASKTIYMILGTTFSTNKYVNVPQDSIAGGNMAESTKY